MRTNLRKNILAFSAITAILAGFLFTGCPKEPAAHKKTAVSKLKAFSETEQVTLSWVNPKNPELESLVILKGDTAETLEQIGSVTDISVHKYEIKNLVNGTNYYFGVTAVYSDGTKIVSNTVCAMPHEKTELELISSVDFAKKLTIGWNLGNTLDATASWTTDTETAWGMPRTTKDMITTVHKAGFETIRIPISWHDHVSGSNYTIDSKWLNRVKEIVDWAYNDGMFVIINIHHDNLSENDLKKTAGFAITSNADAQAKSKAYISRVWEQVAETFANYDNHLIFEILNEPRDVGGTYEWWMPNATTAKPYCDIITAYEQVGIDTIRSTGGYNTERFIMVPAYAASGTDQSILKAYTMPKDSTTDKLLLSTHAYAPNALALSNDMSKTTFGTAEKSSLNSILTFLKNNYTSKGIGVVMGESSCTDKNNLDERIKWASYYFSKAKECGIPVVLWDNMVIYPDGNDGAERHGHFNRRKLVWYYPEFIKSMMKAVYGDTITIDDEDNPSNPPADNNNTDNLTPVTIVSEPLDLTDWDVQKVLAASVFADAKANSRLAFTYEPCSVAADYKNVKLQAGDWSKDDVYYNGDISGDANLGSGVLVPTAASGDFAYYPTADEWTSIKAKGMVIYGFGVKITKVELYR